MGRIIKDNELKDYLNSCNLLLGETPFEYRTVNGKIILTKFMLESEIETFIIPEFIDAIGKEAFKKNNYIKGVVIPKTVKHIYKGAFSYCDNLAKVIMYEGVTSIGCCAFGFCHNLEEVKIPDSVKVLDSTCFCGCDNLTNLELPSALRHVITDSRIRYSYNSSSVVGRHSAPTQIMPTKITTSNTSLKDVNILALRKGVIRNGL